MTDNTESLVIEHLRHLRTQIDGLARGQQDIKARIGSMENRIGSLESQGVHVREDLTRIDHRIDHIDVRLSRIDRRLNITEEA